MMAQRMKSSPQLDKRKRILLPLMDRASSHMEDYLGSNNFIPLQDSS